MIVLREKTADGSSRYRVVEAGAGMVADGEASAPSDAGNDQAGLADDASHVAERAGSDTLASAISDARAAA
jgi:hypothetical protein